MIRATFRNASTKYWLRSGEPPGSVNIGYFVHNLSASAKVGVEFRSHLSDTGVKPGQSVTVDIEIGALDAGRYRVDIDLVSEHVRWFQANGCRIASVSVVVL